MNQPKYSTFGRQGHNKVESCELLHHYAIMTTGDKF